MIAISFRAVRVRHFTFGQFTIGLTLALSCGGLGDVQAAPFNLAPGGDAIMGWAVDTFGSDDVEYYHHGPIPEMNDQVYLTGSVGLAPNAYIIAADPDGVVGPQSNGIDTCCNADFGFHYAGILFPSAVNGVNSVQVQNFIANDGGWWGPAIDVAGGAPLPAGDIASPLVQVTTNGGDTWNDVATLTSDYVSQLTGVVRGTGFPFSTRTPFSTITFASQSGINGVRLIGDGAGAAGGPGGGFIAVTELQVLQEAGVVFPTLDVNTTTGAMTLKTTAGTARGIRGYTIASDASVGAIDSSGWLSVADNYDQGNPGTNQIDADDPWTELSAATSHTQLSEAELSGGNGGSLAANRNLPLGNTWIPNPFGDDLHAEVLLADGSVRRVDVTYNGLESNFLELGDLNFDGVINALDWPTVRDNFNTTLTGLTRAESYAFGDLNGDFQNDAQDFALFKAIFDAQFGPGAFAAMAASQVPEPSSIVMLILGMGLIGVWIRKGKVIV